MSCKGFSDQFQDFRLGVNRIGLPVHCAMEYVG